MRSWDHETPSEIYVDFVSVYFRILYRCARALHAHCSIQLQYFGKNTAPSANANIRCTAPTALGAANAVTNDSKNASNRWLLWEWFRHKSCPSATLIRLIEMRQRIAVDSRCNPNWMHFAIHIGTESECIEVTIVNYIDTMWSHTMMGNRINGRRGWGLLLGMYVHGPLYQTHFIIPN